MLDEKTPYLKERLIIKQIDVSEAEKLYTELKSEEDALLKDEKERSEEYEKAEENRKRCESEFNEAMPIL